MEAVSSGTGERLCMGIEQVKGSGIDVQLGSDLLKQYVERHAHIEGGDNRLIDRAQCA